MSARKNLDEIIARSLILGPVEYTLGISGVHAIQLNFLAIKLKRPVEELIVSAIEDYCYVEMLLSGDAQ